jgi:hypothetical protein
MRRVVVMVAVWSSAGCGSMAHLATQQGWPDGGAHDADAFARDVSDLPDTEAIAQVTTGAGDHASEGDAGDDRRPDTEPMTCDFPPPFGCFAAGRICDLMAVVSAVCVRGRWECPEGNTPAENCGP